jgi:pyruvate-formate lyase-activating enzyme
MRRLPIAAAAHEHVRAVDEGVAFRDPPPPDGRAAKLAIARMLVRAETLPVFVPALNLDLIDVRGAGRVVDLVFGAPDEVARLRVEGPERVSVVEIAGAARHRDALAAAARRVGRSIDQARWEAARTLARDLTEIDQVPLTFLRQIVSGVAPKTGLVRVGFQCNQDCGMCWQGRSWGRYDGDAILAWLEDLATAGVKRLILSGGEPMMDRRLVEYVARARELGIDDITLETNAILASREELAIRLRDAGLGSAFVSLHSADPGVSDAITRAPGTHARTVRGVHAFLEAGVPVKLNAVLTREGIDHVASLPAFIAREFGGSTHLRGLMLSYPTAPFDVALRDAIAPPPEAMRAALRETIENAVAVDLPLDGLDGPCGPPLCAFDADPRVSDRANRPGTVPFRRFLPPCDRCTLKDACLGVHEISIALHGDAAVHPL